MTNRLDIYYCHKCGNLIEILLNGQGKLVCCDEVMHQLNPQNLEAEGQEKHIPIFIKNECGNTEIRVGSIPHPMTEEHYIMFIQCYSENKNKIYTEFLKPNSTPRILIKTDTEKLLAREYCNIHGLWEGKKND